MIRRALRLAVFFLIPVSVLAQKPAGPAAPIPPAIHPGAKIFVSNAGADSGLFPEPFSGDPNRAYAQFYSALQTCGNYTLVSDPSEADLVLELQLIAPYGPTRGSKQWGAADPLPMFRLVVYDRRSHYVLWAITESIEFAILQKTHDRNFDDALGRLFTGFQALAHQQLPPASPLPYRLSDRAN